jgi:predicted AlkP superfamily pyrophosphatase or phosphodiesterase
MPVYNLATYLAKIYLYLCILNGTMKNSFLFQLSILIIILVGCKSQQPVSTAEKTTDETPYVILISIDGFRYDYAEQHQAVNIQKLGEEGVRAESMTSVYPTKTFPNHYSIVTGLFAENHGLVSNTFYDPNLDLTYRIGNRKRVEDERFYGGTPLWVLAEEQGMKSACYFWVGSEAPVKGIRPSYYYVYDGKVPNQTRVDQAVKWLELPETERPRFITLYFSDVDDEGHRYGPDAPETKSAVQSIDSLIGDLRQRTQALGLPVNIVVVSDHGMIKVDRSNPMVVEKMADFAEARPVVAETHTMIYSQDEAEVDRIYDELLPQAGEKFRLYKKEEIPENLHFKNHHRIGEILMIANAPHVFASARWRPGGSPGVHGFDPYTTPEMGAIFYANGPSFKRGMTIPAFDNVHVYPMIAKILGLEVTEAIDGDLKVLEGALVE